MLSIKRLALTIFITGIFSCIANAEDGKEFHGFYLGADIGYRELSSDSGLTYGVLSGYRYQTDSDFVIGFETSIGAVDSDSDDLGTFTTNGLVGRVFGKNRSNLIFISGGIESAFGVDDADGLLGRDSGFNISGGYERAISSKLHIRLNARYSGFGQGVNGFGLSGGVIFKF